VHTGKKHALTILDDLINLMSKPTCDLILPIMELAGTVIGKTASDRWASGSISKSSTRSSPLLFAEIERRAQGDRAEEP